LLQLLLAEDNPGDVSLVRKALAQVELDIVVASDGEEAMRHLRSSHFDLVILDLNLPKYDGQAILQLFANTPEAPPFVIFSSSMLQVDRELALLVGAKDYIVKPTYLDDFVEAVQGIINRWGTQRVGYASPDN
jgi:two-component system, OmpR family, response regulator TctD